MASMNPAQSSTDREEKKTTQTKEETEETDETEENEEELTVDDVHHILQNPRRRQALIYLNYMEGSTEMRPLAEQVAAWENDTTPENLTSKERQRVYISLYQNHLPVMDQHNAIEYNQDRGHVERGKHAKYLEYYIGGPLSEIPEPPEGKDATFDISLEVVSEAGMIERMSTAMEKAGSLLR